MMPEVATFGLALFAMVVSLVLIVVLLAGWLRWIYRTLTKAWPATTSPSQPFEFNEREHISYILNTLDEYKGHTWLIRKITYIKQPYVVRKIYHEDICNRELYYFADLDEAVDLFLEMESHGQKETAQEASEEKEIS